MKRKVTLLSFLLIQFCCFTQSTFPSTNSIGFEALGNGGIYSIVYNRTIATKNKFNIQFRPQLSVIPGENESSIPSNLVPIIGLNSQFLFNKWLLNLNVSTGIDINWGNGKYGPKMINSISFGPKIWTDFAIWGISYGYFLKEPEFFFFDTYPHFFGLSVEAEF